MLTKALFMLPLAAFALIAAKAPPPPEPTMPSIAAPADVAANPANSQFFIMFVPNAGMTAQYSLFGRVISGMDAVDKIAPGEPPPEPTKIVKAYLGDMAAVAAK